MSSQTFISFFMILLGGYLSNSVSITTNLSLQEYEALVQTSLNEGQPLGNLVLLNQRSDLDLSALADLTLIFRG